MEIIVVNLHRVLNSSELLYGIILVKLSLIIVFIILDRSSVLYITMLRLILEDCLFTVVIRVVNDLASINILLSNQTDKEKGVECLSHLHVSADFDRSTAFSQNDLIVRRHLECIVHFEPVTVSCFVPFNCFHNSLSNEG